MISYFKETIAEFKKLALPSKKEVYITTGAIFVVVTIFAVMITFSDFVISKIMGLIFGI
jgi:preprotein translocase SecE subunit